MYLVINVFIIIIIYNMQCVMKHRYVNVYPFYIYKKQENESTPITTLLIHNSLKERKLHI